MKVPVRACDAAKPFDARIQKLRDAQGFIVLYLYRIVLYVFQFPFKSGVLYAFFEVRS